MTFPNFVVVETRSDVGRASCSPTISKPLSADEGSRTIGRTRASGGAESVGMCKERGVVSDKEILAMLVVYGQPDGQVEVSVGELDGEPTRPAA